ncbi:PREDICTED: sesquipedalian-1, partial [Nestor notabilis]|uniref:sesquipedalian-1 n=1 Tax=Nestor notabilis TaxID=176057 RepID=UPI000523CCD3
MKLNERSLAFYATCDSPADNLEKQLEERRYGTAGGCAGGCQGSPGSWKLKPSELESSLERLPALPAVLPKENGCAVWNNASGADQPSEASGCGGDAGDGNPQPPPVPPRRRASSTEVGSAVVESPSSFCRLHEWYGREVAQLRRD